MLVRGFLRTVIKEQKLLDYQFKLKNHFYRLKQNPQGFTKMEK